MKKIWLLVLTLFLISSCRVAKLGMFYLSDYHSKPKFDKNAIKANSSDVYHFHQGKENISKAIADIPYSPGYHKNKKGLTYRLDDWLEKTSTTAFLVIRNDSILYESYFDGYDEQSQLTSFSVAKSFTSALIGIAIQEGIIASIDDPVTKYIEELNGYEGYWSDLRIEHLLNMRSGIDFNEDSYANPYSTISSLYMKKDVFKVIKKLKFKAKPGTRKYYSSMDTQLLGLVLERASGVSLASFMEEKLWGPMGMEHDGTWSVDSEKKNNTKAFCCLQISARDYAKFGRLYLNEGNWNGQQIIDKSWVDKSIQPDFKNNCYQYQWYSANKKFQYKKDEMGQYAISLFPDSLSAAQQVEQTEYRQVVKYGKNWAIRECGPSFYAFGIFAQEVYVNPEQNLIFVRLGKKWDTSNLQIFNLIEKQVVGF